MAVKGFSLGGSKETMVVNISTTKRFPIERADNEKRPPMTREERDVWDTDDPAPAPAASVAVSKAPTNLRAELEAQLARKKAQAGVPHPPSPMRAALEAELARRQGGAAAVRRSPPPRYASPYSPGSMDPPEGIGSGAPPPGGIKVR